MEESDNIADINDENVDINHADRANDKPIAIIVIDLSDSERDRHLILTEVLEGWKVMILVKRKWTKSVETKKN